MRGVYIHIPFCNSICSYCDFCKVLNYNDWASRYLDALNNEIDEYYENDTVKSIYIGGGTPSSLDINDLMKLFRIIRKFKTKNDFEFTFECNINDISSELLLILKENNVNRISIGVESFDKTNLKFLNRKHEKKDIFNKIKLVKEYGFDNINVDLMYALPTENLGTLKKDVKNILKLDVDHISTYSLILEEHTMLKNKNINSIDEELDYKMYKYICKKLKKKGYSHYEVSNFARNNKYSRHNVIYWNNDEYYGFGLGSHGYVNDNRYENTRSLTKYLNNEFRFDEVLVSTLEAMENEVMLGLRKLSGVSVEDFEKRFKKSIFDVFKVQDAIDSGNLIYEDGFIYIPEDKIYVMNEIINMII